MGTYLKEAYLKGANFKEANLKGANLRNAHLEEANLEEAQLFETTFDKELKISLREKYPALFEKPNYNELWDSIFEYKKP